LRQKKVTRLAYDSEHGKLWQDIKADLDKTRARASKFADDAEWAFGRRTARVLGVVMLFAVVVALLLTFLNWYINPTEASDKKDLVLAMAQILAGTALLSGLYFTWRTLQVNREGQITDRFTRAIEQLGATYDDKSKNLELRLGAIYALERIAKESEEDHWSIMEVLTAYVRQHAPWRPAEGQQGEENAPVEKPEEYSEGSSQVSEPTKVPTLDPDIQAIMTVIRRRTRSFRHGEPEPLDLHRTNLRRANLREANLREANLWAAFLRRADLESAYLRGANLREANLTKADLRSADLWGAFLMGADFTSAFLTKATLRWGRLRGADLTLANLREANLTKADLRGGDLSRARGLIQAQLEEAIGDETTALPPNLKPPAHWDVKTDQQIEGN
jgi:hypothetical protein